MNSKFNKTFYTCLTESPLFLDLRYRVRQLVYVAYVRTPSFIGVPMILDMRTLTSTLILSLWCFNVLKIFLVLIILYYLKTYLTFNLFVCPWKRQILYCLHLFQKTLFFNFSYKLLNKYFSLPQSPFQFRASVRK